MADSRRTESESAGRCWLAVRHGSQYSIGPFALLEEAKAIDYGSNGWEIREYVPCDDAAVMRGAVEIGTLPDYILDRAAGGDQDALREIAETVFRAAGETE